MSVPSDITSPPAASGWTGFFGRLSVRAVAVALALGTLAAVALNPIFITPFPVVLGRMLFISLVLLLAIAAAGQWRQERLPRWLVQALAVVWAAPFATFLVYLLPVSGDAAALLRNQHLMSGFVLIAGTAGVVGLVLTLGSLLREREAQARSQQLQFELERQQLERQALDARLSLLRAQIQPHFLFNTLANVQALVEAGSPRAAGVLKSLIAYLRAAVPRLDGEAATLAQEAALVRAYLELMQMRMPDRLQVTVALPDELLGQRFPPMLLLTLVENAVRHGIDPSEAGGRIEVGAERAADGSLRLWVADTGVGMSEQAASGTGLDNVRARLAAFFGPAARLQLSEMQPHGLRAELQVPPQPEVT